MGNDLLKKPEMTIIKEIRRESKSPALKKAVDEKISRRFAGNWKRRSKEMKMPDVKKKALTLGIDCGKMKKAELIHTIQKKENYTPCYGSSKGQCQYVNCCFRDDCLNLN
jgi:hypothetical protein